MSTDTLQWPIPGSVLAIAEAVARANGRALVVGGYVRDRLLGIESKDVDIEVYGLSLDVLQTLLSDFGEVIAVGRAFGVLRVKGLDVDFALPRKDNKTGAGHRGFVVATDPFLDYGEAARRRDLTINCISYDPLNHEIVDPLSGRTDLERGVLRAADAAHFAEDPLRGLRAAQFAARLEMQADDELLGLLKQLDLAEVSSERIFEEFKKLLLKGTRPSLGFELMRETGLLSVFPELSALIGVQQDAQWHPEGDVWVHTMMVVDEAAGLRASGDDLALMFGALCHDFGKPLTTELIDGRIRSRAHDVGGVAPTRTFMERMNAPKQLVKQVESLVEHHLSPALFVKNGAGAKAYRKLSRKLAAAGVDITLLHRVATADHFGRTTPDALRREFPAGETFLERADAASVLDQAPTDVVLGRHLIERGLKPGPQFADILQRCRELQDETGFTDPERILRQVLS